MSLKTGKDSPFRVAYEKAVLEINQRFFSLKSNFGCRVIFAGVLDVAHSLPEWLQKIMNDVATVLLRELQLLTGATPPHSPRDSQGERYEDHRSIQEILADSAPPSELSEEVCDELHDFLATRRRLDQLPFTVFWKTCPRFRHIRQLAMKLRAYPTNTVALEQSFSRARRVLSWSRMRMSQETANKLWLLICNEPTTRHILRVEQHNDSERSRDTVIDLCAVHEESDSEEVFSDNSEGE